MGLWQPMMWSDVIAPHPFSIQLSVRRRWLARARIASEGSVDSFQLDLSTHDTSPSGTHAPLFRRRARLFLTTSPREEPRYTGPRGTRQGIDTSRLPDLCGAPPYMKARLLFSFLFFFFPPHKNSGSHLRVNVATFVGRKKKKKNYLEMKLTALTSGGKVG